MKNKIRTRIKRQKVKPRKEKENAIRRRKEFTIKQCHKYGKNEIAVSVVYSIN